MGPKEARSTVLTPLEEAAIIAFRKQTLLPLDDVLFALQPSIPRLTRSSLHRLLERPASPSAQGREQDLGEVALQELPDRLLSHRHLRAALCRGQALPLCRDRPSGDGRSDPWRGPGEQTREANRTSKLAYAELHGEATRWWPRRCSRTLSETVPYQIHTVLTDNGIQFTHTPGHIDLESPCGRPRLRANGIEHRLTQPNHTLGDLMIAVPAGTDRQLCCRWTNGQVERMNRTIKEAAVRVFHYASADEFKRHFDAFLLAYNHARRLKTLKGKTPYDFICHRWTVEPQRFRIDPHHHSPGPNS